MAKKKLRRQWTYAPRQPTPTPVPDDFKAGVEAGANDLIERLHITPW